MRNKNEVLESINEVLRKKEADLDRIKREMEALRTVALIIGEQPIQSTPSSVENRLSEIEEVPDPMNPSSPKIELPKVGPQPIANDADQRRLRWP
jgi:hypothetical protein